MNTIKSIVRTHPDSQMIYLRNVVILAFFIDKPVHEISESLTELLDRFVESTPPDTLKWAVTSATQEEWREFNSKTIPRLKAALAPEGARKRKLTAFRLNDYGPSAPRYSFELIGKPIDEDWPYATTLVQMNFPIETLQEDRIENLVSQVRELVKLASPASGYCAPGMQFSELHMEEAFYDMKGIAMRHPGYDVQINSMTHVHIGNRVRGARWITLIGPEITKNLGGIEKLEKLLSDPISVETINSTTMIRAGKLPEIGDTNRRVKIPLLREVAKVLEPATLFNEIDLLSNLADFDDDFLQRWERRFLDDFKGSGP